MPYSTLKLSVARLIEIKSSPAYACIRSPDRPPAARSLRVALLSLTLLIAGVATAADDRSADVLGKALEAEFALQAGDLPAAARGYAQAAVHSEQVDLIERAATVALYAKNYAAAESVGQRWIAVDAQSVGALRTLAWAAMATGKRAQADVLLAQLMDRQTVAAQRAVAQVLVAAENRKDAPESLRLLASLGALKALPEGPSWSAVASNLQEYQVATQLAQAETKAQPKNADAWRHSAQVALAAGDKVAALSALERAVTLAPEDFDLRLALAGVHADAGRNDLADRVLAQARPQDDRVLAARLANVASKPERKLLKRIERTLLDSAPAQIHSRAFLLGQLYELKKEPDLALSWYLQEPPGVAWHEAQLRRSVLLARDKHDLAGARSVLAELRSRVDDIDQRVDAWLLEAELLTPADKRATALVYDEALTRHPQDVRLLYARAMFRIAEDDVSGLEQDLRSILAQDPDNAQALNALGYTLADRTDRHQEALGYIERAFAKQPDDGAVIDSMGWVQYRLGNLPEALNYLKRAYERVPDGEVAAHLAEVLWSAGQRDEATALWREAMQRWPETPALIDSIRRLQPTLLP